MAGEGVRIVAIPEEVNPQAPRICRHKWREVRPGYVPLKCEHDGIGAHPCSKFAFLFLLQGNRKADYVLHPWDCGCVPLLSAKNAIN